MAMEENHDEIVKILIKKCKPNMNELNDVGLQNIVTRFCVCMYTLYFTRRCGLS